MSRFNDNPEGIYDPTATLAIEHVIHEQKARPYRPFVYVCSRYSGRYPDEHSCSARYCQFAVKRGCIPIASHIFYVPPAFLMRMIQIRGRWGYLRTPPARIAAVRSGSSQMELCQKDAC